MGSQIHFYKLPEDRKAFLQYFRNTIQRPWLLEIPTCPRLNPLTVWKSSRSTLCVSLAPELERNWVPDPGYFRLDTLHKPV
jgi:hypothetical protein